MSSILIAYYSATGNTAKIVEFLAEKLGADVEEIREPRPREVSIVEGEKPSGDTMRSALQGMLGLGAKIEPPQHDASQYDLVVIAAPTWLGSLASPMRTYLRQNRKKFRKVAFLKSCGELSEDRVFKQMTKLTRQEPVAVQAITAKECDSGDYMAKAEALAAMLHDVA